MKGSRSSKVELPPVLKRLDVALPVEEAFRLFTAGIGSWWPLASHSLGGDNAATCFLEGQVGGRLYEVNRDGSEALWGTVLVWDPPHRLAFTWHPGREPSTAQEVEVRFSQRSQGTLVQLTHRGWERLADQAEETWKSYEHGWDVVLARYRSLAYAG